MSRTILILGAGTMQIPAIRAARRLGCHVIVADGNRNAVGLGEADEFIPVDLRDRDGMVEAATLIRERRGLDGVFTAGTDFFETVAYVADRLGLPGTSLEGARNATDKYRMRRVLRAAGVRVPNFAVLTDAQIDSDGAFGARGEVGMPVVVKPADNMGARGVMRVNSWREADIMVRRAVVFSRSGRVVMEEFIEGPEFSLDAIVYGDDIQITGFADRHIRFDPYFVEMGHTIPTTLPESDRAAVIAEFVRAIRALGIGPGAAKGDVKLSPSGPVIGEVAARLSGGYMSGWTYPLSSGVPLSEIGVRVALGEAPPRARPQWNRTAAERAVISIPGTLAAIEGVEHARGQVHVEEVFLTRDPGSHVVFPTNNVEKVGNVIACADTRDQACEAADRAVSLIQAVLAPDRPDTDRFLFHDPASAGPQPEYAMWAFPTLECDRGDLRDLWARTRARTHPAGSVVTLPAAVGESTERDWSHRTPAESVRLVQADARFEVVIGGKGTTDALSRLVLRALAKGGAQGARYVLDSL